MRVRNFYLLIVLLTSPTPVLAAEHADLTQLRSAVKAYLTPYYQSRMANHSSADIQVSVSQLDPRLKLASCDKPLTFELRDSGNPGGNVAVKTRCPGPSPWAIYVRAQVAVKETVVVAASNLTRGTVLSEEHLNYLSLDTSDLGQGFVTDPERLIGKAVSRHLQRGRPITLGNLAEPEVINRGDAVVLEAQTGIISVATQATALSNGKVGDQIRVRNDKSEQVIRALVVGHGRVQAVF